MVTQWDPEVALRSVDEEYGTDLEILAGHGMDTQLDPEVERRCHSGQQAKNMFWI